MLLQSILAVQGNEWAIVPLIGLLKLLRPDEEKQRGSLPCDGWKRR